MNKQFPEPAPCSKAKRPAIALQSVQSSQVKAIGYDASSKTLAVQFARGAGSVYHYPNVEPDTFEAFKAAKSIGTFFGQHIKPLEFEKFAPESDGDEQKAAA